MRHARARRARIELARDGGGVRLRVVDDGRGVPDELAYQMAKQLYENLETLHSAHNAAKAIQRDKAIQGMPVPLHPGAERYYKEVGLIK